MVGYVNLNTAETDFIVGCNFVSTDGVTEGIKFSDIKGEFEDYDNIQVASIVDGKITFTDYYYFSKDGGMVSDTGWYADDMVTFVGNETLKLGSAIWFGSGTEKAVTLSGQVYKGDFTHKFTETQEMVCSAFPVAFNPNKATWVGLQDYDNIQTSSVVDGKIVFTDYYYFSAEGGMVSTTGWYLEDMETMAGEIAVPGQGFWLTFNGEPSEVSLIETTPLK